MKALPSRMLEALGAASDRLVADFGKWQISKLIFKGGCIRQGDFDKQTSVDLREERRFFKAKGCKILGRGIAGIINIACPVVSADSDHRLFSLQPFGLLRSARVFT